MKVYLDNSATSFPKPPEVTSAMLYYMTNIGSNPGRGASSSSLKANEIIFNCRNEIANFFNFDKPQNVIFTSNITSALNTLIKSSVKKGWHVITSSMDHNAVLRPLYELKKKGIIDLSIIPCDSNGRIHLDEFKKSINKNTKLVVMSHASNIIGTLQPLEDIGKICKSRKIFFIVDSAQTAGIKKLDFKKLNCSALCFTGHKGLLGPQGIGGFIIDDDFNDVCSTFIEGGTGSLSSEILQPSFLPDKFESGTLNSPGIAGLLNSIKYINKLGLDYIDQYEQYLCQKFIDGLLNIDTIKVYGFKDSKMRISSISINSTKINNAELGYILDSDYSIITRTGLHCAPLAHKTIGTFPDGTIRFSIGIFNNLNDINYTLQCINSIIKRCD